MILCLFSFVLFTSISCIPLMPDQSVITVFDNSRNKPSYSTSTSPYGRNIDVVEGWDSVTSPPRKVLGTVICTPNAVHKAKEKVIAIEKSDIVYSSGGSGKDKLHMHGTDEEHEKSDSISSSKRDEVNEMNNDSERMTLDDKRFVGNSMNKCNSSTCYFLSTNPTVTVTLESTSFISSTVNDTLKKISNKVGFGKFASDLRITDIVEIFNTMAILMTPTLSFDVTITTHYSSLSDNSTFRSANDEFFDEVDEQTVTHFTGKTLDRSFSQIHRKGQAETNSGDNINIDDYTVVKNGQDIENFEKKSKLSPQVIPRSEFAKNGISEEENEIISGCDIDTSKEDSGRHKSSNCEAVDEKKLWEPRDETHEKYDKENEKDGKSPVLVHFERTLWEKLVAGLKCSQRDCREALRPTESVRRYLIEPSISRARKHSNGQS